MPTLRERAVRLLAGPSAFDAEREQLRHLTDALLAAYQEGPYELPPQELVRQLREQYDSQLVMDLVDQLAWEQLGAGYQPELEAQRGRAVDDSRRMWLYSVMAQWIVRLWTYYAVGESVQVIPQDERAAEPWDEFWTADRNSPVLATERLHDISNMLLVTGNRFLVFFLSEQDGEATVRRVNPDEVVQIVTKPGDASTPLFYKRQWTEDNSRQRTEFYPDWRWYFEEDDPEELRAVLQDADVVASQDGTAAVMLHAPFEQKDETSLFGWPLLAPAGTPWLRSHRQFMENRLAVSRAVASYVRRRQTPAGSRAVDYIMGRLQSTLQTGATSETNPPPVAGSEDVTNKAVETTDLAMRTGAQDAKADNESFAWMAGLSGGIYPHYLGLGDAYRLATASSMERPMFMQFSLYRNRLNAIFRDMVRIVLQAQEKFSPSKPKYGTYEARIAADRLVEADLAGISDGVSKTFRDVVNPQALLGQIPEEMRQNMTVYSLQSVLHAMGAEDVQEMVNVEQYEGQEEETELTEAQRRIIAKSDRLTAKIDHWLEKLGEQKPEGQPLAEQDKVEPRGEPLEPWPEGEPVSITPEDVARAIKDWDRHMPDEAKGLLTARTLTPEEEAALEPPDA